MKSYLKIFANLLLLLACCQHTFSQQTITYTPGTYTVTVPSGVTKVTAKVLGAGSSGTGNEANGGNGGGGGGYCQKTFIVQAGQTINMVVSGGNSNSVSSVSHALSNTNLAANSGNGTTGGTSSGGSINFTGGNGAGTNGSGGGGGQAACEFGNGVSANSQSGATNGSCGASFAGGNGGDIGMIMPGFSRDPGFPGFVGTIGSGGGGGGAGMGGVNGGAGGNGQVILIMDCDQKSLTFSANNTGSQSAGIQVLDHNNLDFTTALTLEAWIKPTAFENAVWQGTIIAKDNWANANQSTGHVLRCGGVGQLDFTYGNNVANQWNSFTSATNALTAGVWQHVAVTFQQNVAVKMYVNGVSVPFTASPATTTYPNAITANTQILGIGSNYYDRRLRNFNGQIDEVRLWNVAKSATEIAFSKDREVCSTTGLVANYKMNATITSPDSLVVNTITGGMPNGKLNIVNTTTSGLATIAQTCDGVALIPVSSRVYVNDNATGANNGSSWADAYTDLQVAIAAPNLCGNITEIWVAGGTYYPTTSLTDKTATFAMKNNLALYGSFAGNETTLTQRTLSVRAANKSILSGDIDRNGILDDGNSFNVILNSKTVSTPLFSSAVIDGFGITMGLAYNGGGGINNLYASPRISNCDFFNNYASGGGGLYNVRSNPTVVNCSFINNVAITGGAIILYESSPKFINCIFIKNSTSQEGGAVYNSTLSNPQFSNSTFVGNISSYQGGAIFSSSSSISITNCIIWGNTQTQGDQVVNTGTVFSSDYSLTQGLNPSSSGRGNLDGTNPNNNPRFVDAPNDNYRLQPCSPAINVGTSIIYSLDLDNNLRTFGSDPDLGAYELQSPKTNCTVTSAQTGAWANTATWVGNLVPFKGDNVIINHPISLSTQPQINKISFGALGSLQLLQATPVSKLGLGYGY